MKLSDSFVREDQDDNADKQLFEQNLNNSLPNLNKMDHPEALKLENIADANLSQSGNIESFVRFLRLWASERVLFGDDLYMIPVVLVGVSIRCSSWLVGCYETLLKRKKGWVD